MPPKVWMPQLIDLDLIDIDPENTNKQDLATFKELERNIAEEGMDENIIIVPTENGRFRSVSGSHRVLAARANALQQVPAVVRDDWDDIKAAVQGVRRNLSRGKVDETAFTNLVNKLHEEENLNFDEIQAEMGIVDQNLFASLYESERKQKELVERIENEQAGQIKIMDDLTALISHIIEEYGHTLHMSYLCFPLGGKNHVFVSSTNAMRNVLERIMARCAETGTDLNTALTGLLHLGISKSKFMEENKQQELDDLEKELTKDEEDSNFNL